MAKKHTAKKPHPAKAEANTSFFSKFRSLIKSHRLLSVLVLALLLVLFGAAYNQYKDWDNAQMIKGLARDFPVLVSDIEQATGLELDIKSDCSTTTEKFSNGVKTCEIIFVTSASPEQMEDATEATKSSDFVYSRQLENGLGQKLKYRNKNSCNLGQGARGDGVLSVSCIIAVREANVKLAAEQFSKIAE